MNINDSKRVYLAGPLFTLAEREFNGKLGEAIEKVRPTWVVVLPQERAKKLEGREDFLEATYRQCLADIEASDCVVACLDGPDSDSGTCVEIGYALARGKCIVGVRTDFRGSEDRGLNLMVSMASHELVLLSSLSASVEEVANAVVQRIETTFSHPVGGDSG